MNELNAQVGHLRELVSELATITLGRAFGLNLIDLQLLKQVLPTIQGTVITFGPYIEEHTGAQTVERCIELLANYAIRLTEELDANNHPAWGVTGLL
ncbi:MAG: hypothetical protein WDO68_25405 [Gammaproteobacteria bacterium]